MVLPSQILNQPTLIRLMIGVALLVLPAVAWVDYQQGYYFAFVVEVTAAVTLFSMIFLIRPLGTENATRVTLLVMFALALIGSFEKLDSAPNFAWFTIMPFLYISVGGLRLGLTLTIGHFLFIAGCYLTFANPVVHALTAGTWIQVGLAYCTAAGLAVSYEHVQRKLRLRLRALADQDSLTGLLNRRGMERRLDELSSLLRRKEMVVTLALLDIDHFKQVNDEYGHDVGDTVLRELSEKLSQVFRDSDYLARWGGEEFLVALTDTDVDSASSVLERLRREIAGLKELSVPSLTLSMGAAEWRPELDLAAALKQADVALYEAKKTGRNKLVAVAAENSQTLPSCPDARASVA